MDKLLANPSDQLSLILDNIGDGLTAQLPDGSLLYANDAAAVLCGFESGQEMRNTSLSEIAKRFLILREDGSPLPPEELPGRLAITTGRPQEAIIRFRIIETGQDRWSRVKSTPVFKDGKVTLTINIFRDITEFYLAQKSLEQTIRNQNFLASCGEVLSSSLDYEQILKSIAQLAVPEFADWCTVDMLQPDGALRRLALSHADPKKVRWAKELAKKYPSERQEGQGVYHVIETGQAEMISEISEELIKMVARDREHLSILQKVGLKSYMCVPLVTNNRTIGAITFLAGETERRFDTEELRLAKELAHRAALAIDNAELYRKAQEAAEREHEQSALLNTIIENAPTGFALFDQGHRYLRVNDALAEINGIPAQDHIGKSIEEIVPYLSPQIAPLLDEVFRTNRPLVNVEISEHPALVRVNPRHWLLNYYPINTKTDSIIAVGVIVNEITERKQFEQTLRESEENLRLMAFHDMLTGLPNRQLFTDRLLPALENASREQDSVAVLFMDLDRFKNINDTLGHTVGDHLLKETAKRLTHSIRKQDTVARIGGDEFIILLDQINGHRDAVKVARKILKAFGPAFVIDGHKLHVSTSIGIALFPTDGDDVATLLKHADTALYRAKEAGRNNYQMYNKTMGIETSEKLRLENELRLALANDELTMYYQPIVNLKSGEITQVEALIRWQHPTLGLIYPNEFIPLAEETGMVVHMAGTIFKKVARQVVKWQGIGLAKFRVALNLSGRQFMQPSMVERIDTYLKDTGLHPNYLELEITESLAMKDIELSIKKLQRLKELGVCISIDDFGTGYSSLNYLKRLPIDTVKIDRSFVQNCISDPQDAAIIRAIISMAHSLGLKTVAEGVETEEQRVFLTSIDCDSIQGYLITRPLPAQEFTKFLRQWKKQSRSVIIP
jgi:diguanylate cyclase (GGDEF)-like protein/PAS domain S-box-containing protein